MLLVACIAHREEAIPLDIAVYNPPAMYQRWSDQAMGCVQALADGTTMVLPFEIEHNQVDVNQFIWIAVMTEQEDGGFPCAKVKSCAGRFNPPDTIYISGQFIQTAWVIKHEIMHYIIKSKGEQKMFHGPPWGLCEYVNN